jgi:hypothetical protein
MSPSTSKSFTAVLEPLRTELRWVIARIPFDVAKAWPVRRRLRVRGEIEGFAFRTSLFPFSRSLSRIDWGRFTGSGFFFPHPLLKCVYG